MKPIQEDICGIERDKANGITVVHIKDGKTYMKFSSLAKYYDMTTETVKAKFYELSQLYPIDTIKWSDQTTLIYFRDFNFALIDHAKRRTA